MWGRRDERDGYIRYTRDDDQGMLDDLLEMVLVAGGIVFGVVAVLVLLLTGIDHLLGTGFSGQFMEWVRSLIDGIGP